MFKKLNIKTLIVILIALIAVYYISDIVGNKERSFRDIVVEIDSSNVSDIFIKAPKDAVDIQLSKTAQGQWKVIAQGNKYPADHNVVHNILSQFIEMKPERVAATKDKSWKKFEVTDSTGTRVIMKNGNKELLDIIIGKFSYSQAPQTQNQNPYQQQRGIMTSFVRLANEDKVFAVEGFLKAVYQKDVNAYRNKQLVNVNKNDLSRIQFTYPDRVINLNKEGNNWMMNGQAADSAKMVKYINHLSSLKSSNFVDPSTQKISDATYKIAIEGNNFSPIQLSAFPTSDTLVKYVVTSSLNPEAEFNGSKAQLFEKVFVEETSFLADTE